MGVGETGGDAAEVDEVVAVRETLSLAKGTSERAGSDGMDERVEDAPERVLMLLVHVAAGRTTRLSTVIVSRERAAHARRDPLRYIVPSQVEEEVGVSEAHSPSEREQFAPSASVTFDILVRLSRQSSESCGGGRARERNVPGKVAASSAHARSLSAQVRNNTSP